MQIYVDYRLVNVVFPIPDIHDALDHLRGSHYFATIDLLSATGSILGSLPGAAAPGTFIVCRLGLAI